LNILKDKRKIALLQWATPAVALCLAGESGLVHLGLSALSAETGDPPIPPLARGSPAESGRPVVSGLGRRCQGASPGGEGLDLVRRQRRAHRGRLAVVKQVGGHEPAMASQRRGGGRRLGVRRAVVSLGGGHCSNRGARRWPEVVLNGKAALAYEGGGRLSASTVPCAGQWSAVSLAWLTGAQEWCTMVGASVLGVEADDEGRAEWVGILWLLREERTTSLSD
jgi:hypothetical protein